MTPPSKNESSWVHETYFPRPHLIIEFFVGFWTFHVKKKKEKKSRWRQGTWICLFFVFFIIICGCFVLRLSVSFPRFHSENQSAAVWEPGHLQRGQWILSWGAAESLRPILNTEQDDDLSSCYVCQYTGYKTVITKPAVQGLFSAPIVPKVHVCLLFAFFQTPFFIYIYLFTREPGFELQKLASDFNVFITGLIGNETTPWEHTHANGKPLPEHTQVHMIGFMSLHWIRFMTVILLRWRNKRNSTRRLQQVFPWILSVLFFLFIFCCLHCEPLDLHLTLTKQSLIDLKTFFFFKSLHHSRCSY